MKQLKEVASVFFKLGCFAFGGPAAHVAMMEEEVVEKRKWMTQQHFLDLMGATNLIPGPNSTEMTMHCGYQRAGVLGLFVAGITFIFPAVIITGILAWLYTEYGQLPNVEPFLIGIKPAVVAIIAGAVLKLGKKAIKNWELSALGIFVFIITYLGHLDEISALLLAGIVGGGLSYLRKQREKKTISFFPVLMLSSVAGVSKISATGIFWVFLKVGSVLYGGGYVLFPYLQSELVSRGWLSNQQLMDAIAAGQFTPGPILSTATFVGFQLNGVSGAVAATLGIFLPSFLFVALLIPLLKLLNKSTFLRAFLDAVNVAAVGIMATVLLTMSIETIVDWKTLCILITAVAMTFFWKKGNSIYTVLVGSILGAILF